MKQLLLRADDLGFSEGVNCGIEKTVREGLIRNCGIMVNMEATAHAVKSHNPGVALGRVAAENGLFYQPSFKILHLRCREQTKPICCV